MCLLGHSILETATRNSSVLRAIESEEVFGVIEGSLCRFLRYDQQLMLDDMESSACHWICSSVGYTLLVQFFAVSSFFSRLLHQTFTNTGENEKLAEGPQHSRTESSKLTEHFTKMFI